ncbi:MAG: tetratricopeptide repeat protein [Bacteroidetes bacterium]|nr:tetratricopeptide repeat protein [Bacteroidota bacterium]
MKYIILSLIVLALIAGYGCKNKANQATALLEKAGEKVNQKDYQGAMALYQEVMKMDQNNEIAYNGMGLCKFKLSDRDGALKDLNRAIELKPDYGMAYYNRAVCKFGSSDLQGAIQDYDKAIELMPDFAHAYVNRGVCKYQLSDLQGAIQDYTKSIELNPTYGIVYFNRGMAKISTKMPDLIASACADFQKALELGYAQSGEAISKYCK